MDNERRIRIMRNALDTIAYEAKEPIIRVYAQSALDETKEEIKPENRDNYCSKHKVYYATSEDCPLCKNQNN